MRARPDFQVHWSNKTNISVDVTFLFLLQALLCCICTCMRCMETQPTLRWPMSTWRRAWGAWPGDPSRSCVVMLGPWQWLLSSTTSCRTRSRQKTASSGKMLAFGFHLTFLLLTELVWACRRHSLTNINTFWCSLGWEIIQKLSKAAQTSPALVKKVV